MTGDELRALPVLAAANKPTSLHNPNLVKAGYCCPPSHQSSIHLQSLSRRIRLVPSRGPNRALSSPRARRHSENKKKRNQNTEKRSHEAACLHPAPRRMHLERHVCPPSCGEAAPCSLFLALLITGSPLVLRCPPCCNIWALHGHSNSFFPPPNIVARWSTGGEEAANFPNEQRAERGCSHPPAATAICPLHLAPRFLSEAL